MKLLRFGVFGHETPGIETEDGNRFDVSDFGADYDESFFANNGIARLKNWLVGQEGKLSKIDPSERLGPPVKKPSKIVCVGLNYAAHAKESGMEPPSEPVLFFKSTTAIVGPNDDVVIPKGSSKTDWEVELAVIIEKKATYVTESEANDYIAGYMLHNDYSERAFQLEKEGQWVKGKSCDTFAPLGPYLATKDEVSDVNDLDLWLKLNGETMQHSNTADLIFNIPFLVSYISQYMTLLPGDIISTGTPFGVGLGLDPPKYLKPGDVVSLGITHLGEATQHIKAFEDED